MLVLESPDIGVIVCQKQTEFRDLASIYHQMVSIYYLWLFFELSFFDYDFFIVEFVSLFPVNALRGKPI